MSRLLRFAGPISALAAGAVCAVLVASCGGGGGGQLSPATAGQLNQALDQIEQAASDGNCSDAASSAEQVATQLDSQASGIDPDLKSALVDGFQRIQELASNPSTCGAVTTQETTTQETTTQDTAKHQTTTVKPPPTQTQTQPNTITTPTQPTTTSTGGTSGNGGGPGL